MKKILFLLPLLPFLSFAQKQIPTSPSWFIVDSDISVVPAFNAMVLQNATGFNPVRVDSSNTGAVTYTYKNNKNETLSIWYRFENVSFPVGKIINYFGVTAPNDVMIDFYNHYLGTNLQSCEEVCYVNGRTFVYHDHVYIARAAQLLTDKGRPNGYASVSFSDTH